MSLKYFLFLMKLKYMVHISKESFKWSFARDKTTCEKVFGLADVIPYQQGFH